jgi:hypothetical protein
MIPTRRGAPGVLDINQYPARNAALHPPVMIVSVGIMMLVEDGHFILGDPVAKFIPEFAEQKVGVENNGKLDLVAVAPKT